MKDKVRLMNEQESDKFKSLVRVTYAKENLKYLELSLRINESIGQQYLLRTQVLREMIDERRNLIDYKSKQFPD